jgi:bifunctional DNA-binding transcriptional regulator/antitoxin component of YhaV-PrlF toxin-antitoxin module
MAEIRMRRKHQITLPASIVREAKIEPDDRLTVTFMNGAIIIKAAKPADDMAQDDVMSYAGLGRGLWGDTHAEVLKTIRTLRDE